MLTQWYERCSRYYAVAATEEEKRLTMMLFQKIFDALASRVCRNRFKDIMLDIRMKIILKREAASV